MADGRRGGRGEGGSGVERVRVKTPLRRCLSVDAVT